MDEQSILRKLDLCYQAIAEAESRYTKDLADRKNEWTKAEIQRLKWALYTVRQPIEDSGDDYRIG